MLKKKIKENVNKKRREVGIKINDKWDECIEEIQYKKAICMKEMIEAQTCKNCGIHSRFGDTCQHCGTITSGNKEANRLMKECLHTFKPIVARMEKIDKKRAHDFVRAFRRTLTKITMADIN